MTGVDSHRDDEESVASDVSTNPKKLTEIRWTRHLITSTIIALVPAVYVFQFSWGYAQDINSRSTALAAVAYGFYVFVVFFAAIACFFLGTDWLRIHRRDE